MGVAVIQLERARPVDLGILHRVSEILHGATDVYGALDAVLTEIVEGMELETGWLVLRDPHAYGRSAGRGYVLAAHRRLPKWMGIDRDGIWNRVCRCEAEANAGTIEAAYNESRCCRLAGISDRLGRPPVHATAPLRAGGQTFGLLNAADAGWCELSLPQLSLLTELGHQIALALDRAQSYRSLKRRRTREQSVLMDLSRSLLHQEALEETLDHLVHASMGSLRADACAVLLPEGDLRTLVFRASCGWRRDPARQARRVRMNAQCSAWIAMQSRQLYVLEDGGENRAAEWITSWARDEGFLGHAVAPMIAGGQVLGVLLVHWRRRQTRSRQGRRFLRLLANQTAIAVESARLREQEYLQRRLAKELGIAHDIQDTLLPAECPELDGWEFAAVYRPAEEVGGDFYDFLDLGPERNELGIIVGDVAGKSISAALLMTLSLTAIRDLAHRHPGPATVLERANRRIAHGLQGGRFVSVVCARLDPATGLLTYANAGLPRPLLARAAGGTVSELDARGIVLGVVEDPRLQERAVRIRPGDVLVVFTDGVTEAMDGERSMFGDEGLRAALSDAFGGGARDVARAIAEAVRAHARGAPPSDDLTLVVAKRTA
ncbi:MAG: SpoIIE family protein phosphatase [Planctomycetota bacterium]|jgi:sigma-B regulation protein RsbU (phosphoserine phosphatase)